jgi:HSP20 family molecular chaperone IbpA
MSDVSRSQRKRQVKDRGVRLSSKIDLQVKLGRERASRLQTTKFLTTPAFSTGLFKKPRNWKFQTKPLFKKIKGPLVDVFHEAEEVLIVIDLGGFKRGDVSLSIKADRYSIFAKRGGQEFREEIVLPPEVDTERCVEHFKNGVLEIVLPRKKESTA